MEKLVPHDAPASFLREQVVPVATTVASLLLGESPVIEKNPREYRVPVRGNAGKAQRILGWNKALRSASTGPARKRMNPGRRNDEKARALETGRCGCPGGENSEGLGVRVEGRSRS